MKKKVINHPFLIVIDGPMGSGKTTVANLLHKKLQGTAYIGLDTIKRLVSGFDKNTFMNKMSQDVIMAMVNEYLKNGMSLIVEWVMRKERVKTLREIAKKQKARYLFYQFNAPENLLLERVKQRTKRQFNKKSLSNKKIQDIEDHHKKHFSFYTEHRYSVSKVFDSKKMTANKIASLILKDIK